jgi:hypothetical protein
MTPRNFFAIWDADTMVATLNLIPQTWSLGGIPLRVAEMGLVGTHPEYRNRGLQRILNREFDRRIREDEYHLAGLEGIPYFYRQFGYEYSVSLDEWATIPLDKLPATEMSGISPLSPKEIPRAMSLLEATQRKHLVHCIRSQEEWETQEKSGIVGEQPSKTYAVRQGGKITAYLRANVKDKARALFEERIKNSPLIGYSGMVPLNLYKVTVTLNFQNGAVTDVKQSKSEQKGDILVNPRIFPKMLLGYRSLAELEYEYPDVRIKPEYRPVIETLFPKGSGHIHTTY